MLLEVKSVASVANRVPTQGARRSPFLYFTLGSALALDQRLAY